MSRTLWPLATLAMLAVIVAGCGNGSAGTGNSTATSGGNSTAATHEKAVKFAECMRANGVSEFPDPADASGAFTIDEVITARRWTRAQRRGSRPSARVRTWSRRGSRAAR